MQPPPTVKAPGTKARITPTASSQVIPLTSPPADRPPVGQPPSKATPATPAITGITWGVADNRG
eukprot:8248968-Prorocentrum_lima.AAC.1